MKEKALKILYLSIVIFITGCNGDIFVDDYLPGDLKEITISENDNNKEINFKSDNWSLINIICETSGPYTTNAYTIDGNITYLPFEEKELGTIHYTSNYIDAHVEKKSGNKLKIILNENLLNKDAKMLIIVSNGIKEENIKLLLAPTHKYQIDSVVYDLDKFETYEGNLKEMESLIVNNASSSPITFKIYPFKESAREINLFYSTATLAEDVFSKLLGNPLPEIIIPDIANGKPVLNDTKVAFGIETQQIATNLDKELSADVTINGFNKRRVIVFNVMRSYYVPYNIYISNPKTGKKLTFSGKISNNEPIDYLIFKQVLDEN